jgi:hypothetical protein
VGYLVPKIFRGRGTQAAPLISRETAARQNEFSREKP